MENSWDRLLDKLGNWLDVVVLNLPNFVAAIVVFILFYWLSKTLGKVIDRQLKKVIKQPSIRELVANISSILILAIGLFIALGIMHLDDVLTSLLAGAGVMGLAVGLALQGTLSNAFSGIFLAVKDVINVGDWVESNGFSGKVVEINLRNSKIKEADNNIVVIPNKMILESPFKNFGLTERIRTTINCGVAYDSNLEEVKKIATDAINELFPSSEKEPIEFHYLEFGGSSINFQLRFWVDATANLTALEAKSKAIMKVKEAFDKNNINIPFPIRTIIQKS